MAIVIFSSIKHLIFVWRLKHLFDKEENISCKFYFWGHGLPEASRRQQTYTHYCTSQAGWKKSTPALNFILFTISDIIFMMFAGVVNISGELANICYKARENRVIIQFIQWCIETPGDIFYFSFSLILKFNISVT